MTPIGSTRFPDRSEAKWRDLVGCRERFYVVLSVRSATRVPAPDPSAPRTPLGKFAPYTTDFPTVAKRSGGTWWGV